MFYQQITTLCYILTTNEHIPNEGGEKFVYRVKKTGSFGGYKIVSEDTNTVKTREDLLNMRSKKKSDR